MGRFRNLQMTAWYVNLHCGMMLCFLSGACGLLSGCGDNVRGPTPAELARFASDDPREPSIDLARVRRARMPHGPYRVVAGDVLQIEMPTILDPQASEMNAVLNAASQTYSCRVRDDGAITLPVISRLHVEGKSLAEIEADIIAAYYPKYVKMSFPVYVSVVEYKTYRLSIVGAVAKPGVYRLRHDQMSLVALLMEAGNIVDKGAAMIEIAHAPSDREVSGARTPARRNALNAAHDSRRTRVVFEREGPLYTTGWLSLERPNESPVRGWLDLGNEPQTQAFLQRAVGRSGGGRANDLRARLLHLAAHLESASLQDKPRSGFARVGWRTLDRDRFEAAVAGPRLLQRTQGQIAADETDEETAPTHVLLPVRGLNMPFADVALQEGDSVSVQRPYKQSVAVVGLVNRPGNMPYSLDGRYTLIEAIAFAGGLDLVADPRCVSIYRLQADGTVRSVTVRLVDPKQPQQLTQAMSMALRPGDVVSVESTLRTRTNVFLDRIFRVNLGLYIRPESLWDNHD